MNSKIIDNIYLTAFPDGFEDEMWINLGKKHNGSKIFETFKTDLSKENLEELLKKREFSLICEIVLKIVKRATVVSVFEKVAFSNYIELETSEEFCNSLYNFLYNYNEYTFEDFVCMLSKHKHAKNANAAKWPIVSFLKAYQDPDEFVLVKPNTVKAVAKALEFDIEYQSRPNYTTYNNVLDMVKIYRANSNVCKNENLMITQAVLFTVVK